MLTITEIARILDLQVNELAVNPEIGRAAADDPLRYVAVEETMQRDFPQAQPQERIDDVAARLAASGSHGVVVVNEDGALTGIVTVRRLRGSRRVRDGAGAHLQG